MTHPATRPAVFPQVLLGVMTILTFGGPLGLLWVLKGGEKANWPPDRPVEWAYFLILCAAVAGLMGYLVIRGIVSSKALRLAREKASRPTP